jgi:hypothetical protein
MSFDTEFDYTNVLSIVTEKISSAENTLTELQNQKDLLLSAPTYSSVVQTTIDNLTLQISALTNDISDMNAVSTEINNVANLSSTDKDTIYYFYTVVGNSRRSFMAKTLFNYLTALADPNISNLMADITTDPAAKTSVAKVIYDSYLTDIRVIKIFPFAE